MFENVTFGWHIWDLGALILLILIIVGFAWHVHNQKKREKDFEDQLADKLTEKSTRDTNTTL